MKLYHPGGPQGTACWTCLAWFSSWGSARWCSQILSSLPGACPGGRWLTPHKSWSSSPARGQTELKCLRKTGKRFVNFCTFFITCQLVIMASKNGKYYCVSGWYKTILELNWFIILWKENVRISGKHSSISAKIDCVCHSDSGCQCTLSYLWWKRVGFLSSELGCC